MTETSPTTPIEQIFEPVLKPLSTSTYNPPHSNGSHTPPTSSEGDSSSEDGKDPLPPLPKDEGIQPLALDAGTPDFAVPRSAKMVRLTGKHPYNCEAKLADLWKAGFLTPSSLFYVRNHGAVPTVTSQQATDWKLRIHGLVEREASFSIQDLKDKFETFTLPITLVCAGNRRKEQNMVSKGLGFNWGAAGVSTGLFTGVWLADLLDFCRPINPKGAFPFNRDSPGKAKHVIFEGIDELPKGKYGTSQRLKWCQDKSKGMMVAWGMNGEELSPDHGYPLRLVVPGQIGGRMVKWMNRIEVSDRESQHFLHHKDNKVLPTQVTADQARQEEHWWYDEKYVINDLNCNAAITVPDHNTILDLESSEPFRIQGYAYTGGGKRISRVEITLDDGESWELAEIESPEDKYRINPITNHPFFGTLDLSETEMSFAWSFFELKVDPSTLKDSASIAVRATDEGLASMPRDMYWNAMSMMNNWWFRVAIHQDAQGLRFEHPTLAGTAAGGWMERFNGQGLNPRYPKFKVDASQSERDHQLTVKKEKLDINALMQNPEKLKNIITRQQLEEHSNETTPWFVVNGQVYDGTSFMADHPGGSESITLVAGEDASEDFLAIHSVDGKKQLAEFHVGQLEEGALPPVKEMETPTDPSESFLEPKKWKHSKLFKKTEISPDSRIFRFALETEVQNLGMPIGHHVYLRFKNQDGNFVQRAYTPFSGNELKGYVDILIKVYKSCSDFPQGGVMTSYLDSLEVGSASIEMKGPLGHFSYLGSSNFEWKHKVRKVRRIGMVCGGSGITPIWSTLKGLIEDPHSGETAIWMVNANRSEADILARAHIDDLVEKSNGRVKLWHTLSGETQPDWAMGKGRVSRQLLETHLPMAPTKEDSETLCLICGPPQMEKAVSSALEEIGWNLETNVVFF